MDQAGSMPTTMHTSTSSSTGTRIQCGGSCGRWGRSVAGGPKNTSTVKRSEYATLNMPARVAAMGSKVVTSGVVSRNTVSAKNISLDRKPLSSGTPAIAALATMASVAVIGIMERRPDSRRMSRVPLSWSTMPAAMNSDALKVAWFMM